MLYKLITTLIINSSASSFWSARLSDEIYLETSANLTANQIHTYKL